MADIVPCRISKPLYLQAGSGYGPTQLISLREHLQTPMPASSASTGSAAADTASEGSADQQLPLILLTLHPGYSAGSYANRDYFELLTPLLYGSCDGKYRLRIYTINHPGHDLPPESKIDRFSTERYSIKEQPAMILPALRWLLQREYAAEDQINLVSYGHSMGGLALAQTDIGQLVQDLEHQGRLLRVKKVLSAPALALSREAKRTLRPLDALNALKHSVGRLPLYERVATTLFRSLAPPLHRLSSKTFSLNPDDSFINFRRQNPFLLLQLARELVKYQLDPRRLRDYFNDTHLFVFTGDRMVDSPALLRAASLARRQGAEVEVHLIKGMHSAERENPRAIALHLHGIIQDMLAG
ncbi:MAG: alpha/beta fold hydrolase [Candidatus Promineifilaceae bacterium]|nr:alpha/beta fold hydrolase [Candidatus Promineifilaceae bacterium]